MLPSYGDLVISTPDYILRLNRNVNVYTITIFKASFKSFTNGATIGDSPKIHELKIQEDDTFYDEQFREPFRYCLNNEWHTANIGNVPAWAYLHNVCRSLFEEAKVRMTQAITKDTVFVKSDVPKAKTALSGEEFAKLAAGELAYMVDLFREHIHVAPLEIIQEITLVVPYAWYQFGFTGEIGYRYDVVNRVLYVRYFELDDDLEYIKGMLRKALGQYLYACHQPRFTPFTGEDFDDLSLRLWSYLISKYLKQDDALVYRLLISDDIADDYRTELLFDFKFLYKEKWLSQFRKHVSIDAEKEEIDEVEIT